MNLKSLIVAAMACTCIASGMAQGYGNGRNHRNDQDSRFGQRDWRRDLRLIVDRTERESNSFRAYFERNFRSNGHEPRYDRGDMHPEHQGRDGQMSLKDAIQNLDEDMERVRREIDRHRDSRYARSLVDDIQGHSNDVDRRMGRVGDWYSFGGSGGPRSWRYDRSDLSRRWSRLRDDIRDMSNYFGR